MLHGSYNENMRKVLIHKGEVLVLLTLFIMLVILDVGISYMERKLNINFADSTFLIYSYMLIIITSVRIYIILLFLYKNCI